MVPVVCNHEEPLLREAAQFRMRSIYVSYAQQMHYPTATTAQVIQQSQMITTVERNLEQVALLSQRGRAMLRVCS